jgi:hypothetical protein
MMKGGFVSYDTQSRDTSQARDISRCSRVCVSSDVATVTGSDCTGGNTSKFILVEYTNFMCCLEFVRFIVEKKRSLS